MTLEETCETMTGLIAGARTREEVEQWALELMNVADAGELTFEPIWAEDLIWDAMDYLSQVTMELEPGTYVLGPGELDQYWEEFQAQMEESSEA